MASGGTMPASIWCVDLCRSHQMRRSCSRAQDSEAFWRSRIASCASRADVSSAVRRARSSRPRARWSRSAPAAPPMTWRWRWWECQVPGSWPGMSAPSRARRSPPPCPPTCWRRSIGTRRRAGRPAHTRWPPQPRAAWRRFSATARRRLTVFAALEGEYDARRVVAAVPVTLGVVGDPLDSPSRPQHPRARDAGYGAAARLAACAGARSDCGAGTSVHPHVGPGLQVPVAPSHPCARRDLSPVGRSPRVRSSTHAHRPTPDPAHSRTPRRPSARGAIAGCRRNQPSPGTWNTSSSSRPTIWRDAATARRASSGPRSTSPISSARPALQPGVNGSWFQPFQIVTGLEVREGNKLDDCRRKGTDRLPARTDVSSRCRW